MKVQTKQFRIGLLLDLIESGDMRESGSDNFLDYSISDNTFVENVVFNGFGLPSIFVIESETGHLNIIGNSIILTLINNYLKSSDRHLRESRRCKLQFINVCILENWSPDEKITETAFRTHAKACEINHNYGF